jgi:hypothetical protein
MRISVMEDYVHRFLAPFFVILTLLAVPGFASAQQGGPDLRLGLGAVLDFGGEAEWDSGFGPDPEDDLKLTPGFRIHLDYDLHKYISLGGFFRLSAWEGDDFLEDRSLWIDLGPRLTGHYDWRDFRFYVAVMPGLNISKLNDDIAGAGLEEWGVGFNMAIAPGFEWWFSNRAALFVEMFGWSGHFFSHDSERAGGDLEISANQVVWQLGVVLGL